MTACRHDLELLSCRICNQRYRQPEYGPWVTAFYPGECAGCYSEIRPGDQIRSDFEDGWHCGLCGDRGRGQAEIRVSDRYL